MAHCKARLKPTTYENKCYTIRDKVLEKNTVDINKSYVRFNGKDLIQTPKTPKSKRVITLPVQTMEIIKKYAGKLYDYRPTDRLFTCTKSYLSHEMIRGCKLSGVKKIRVHDIRHPYVKLKLKILSAYFSRIFGAKVLDFPHDFKSVIGIYTHLFDKHIGKCLC